MRKLIVTMLAVCMMYSPLMAWESPADIDGGMDYMSGDPNDGNNSQESNDGHEYEGNMTWSEVIQQMDNYFEAEYEFLNGISPFAPTGRTTVEPVRKIGYATVITPKSCATILKQQTYIKRCTKLATKKYRVKFVYYEYINTYSSDAVSE